MQLYHVVHKQPESGDEFSRARAAMAACPVAAIRIETLAERRHLATTAQDKAAVQDAWTDRDEWTVQQMSFQKTGRRPFPRPFLQPREGMNNVTDNSIIRNVYWTGHHNEASFGAIPYLVRAFHHHDNNNNNRNNTNNTNSQSSVWIMVDTPKFSKAAVEDVMTVTGPTGPDYLFLTHVDDTADHGKWAARFSNNMKRIFHSSDLGRHNWIGDASLETVEILLPATDVHRDNEKTTAQADGTLTAYNLDGTVLGNDWLDQWENGSLDVVILHTPGHSPGSISLLKRRVVSDNSDSSCPGILFTGDTYAYTTANGGRMTGFGRYGHNRKQQVETLSRILNISKHWDVIAPGHGHARDYRGQDDDGDGDSTKAAEIKVAQDDLIPGLANRRV